MVEVMLEKKIYLHGELSIFSKDQGGLGIINLKLKNKTLLGKWSWKFYNHDEKRLWKNIIQYKYATNRNTSHISPFWREILKEKHSFEISINKEVENGKVILFWKDR